ncbi:MAG: LytTR family transcriptional regulator [Spirosomaceae bacterium]|jgi:two-component system LytT family response regulator|nr:LytTR family transcriptional regulator [Spirosomataceae bacterium]
MKSNSIKLGIRQEDLDPEDILCFEADVNYTKIHFRSGRVNTVAFTLKNIEGQLSGYESFCRVHKSYIVNLNYIQHVEKTAIMLQNEKRILLSRRKRKLNSGLFYDKKIFNDRQEGTP